MRARLDWVLVSLLSVSALGNVYLLGQRSINPSIEAKAPLAPEVGQIFPDLDGKQIDGSPVRIQYNDTRPTLIYVFSATCIWCERNAESIRDLIESTSPKMRVVALSPSPITADQAEAKGLRPDLVVMSIKPTQIQQGRLGSTPMTLVVESGGKISHVWTGAYSDGVRSDISASLAVPMPKPPVLSAK